MNLSVSVQLLESRGGDERGQVAPAVARLDERHVVPFERLLDDERGAQGLVERAGRLVAGEHPYDHAGRAVRRPLGGDRPGQAAAEPAALDVLRQVDRGELRVEALLRLLEPVARG